MGTISEVGLTATMGDPIPSERRSMALKVTQTRTILMSDSHFLPDDVCQTSVASISEDDVPRDSSYRRACDLIWVPKAQVYFWNR